MAVTIDIIYQEGLHCAAVHRPSGVSLWTDAPLDNGGRGASFSPTDLVATALGTCFATIMGLVAERHGVALEGLQVEVQKRMCAAPLRRIEELAVTVTFPPQCAAKLSLRMRDRLEAAATPCPVHASLHPEVRVPVRFVYEAPATDES